jgi:aspartate oxidase
MARNATRGSGVRGTFIIYLIFFFIADFKFCCWTDQVPIAPSTAIRTDLNGQALAADGTQIPGLYAVGEASGFGGGGIHGYRALEGTLLGGCLFTGRQAGRFIAGVS